MGWLGDLFNTVKQKATNVYDIVAKTAHNWLRGNYLAPGYNYCGPQADLENGEPVNASDALCRQHDLDYDRFAKMRDRGEVNKDELKRLIRESDDRLVSGLQQTTDRDLGSRLAEYGIRAKKKLEDWGVLDPERFVV